MAEVILRVTIEPGIQKDYLKNSQAEAARIVGSPADWLSELIQNEVFSKSVVLRTLKVEHLEAQG